MPLKDDIATQRALEVARSIAHASDDECPLKLDCLRQDRWLLVAVREINSLLHLREHRNLAIQAFKRIGLWSEVGAY